MGLAGEIRPVSGTLRRLAEADRLGFGTAYVPPGVLGSGALPEGLRVVEVPDLATAVAAAVGASIEPLYRATEGRGVSTMQADLALARQVLGFEPRVALDEGLRLILERDPRFGRVRASTH